MQKRIGEAMENKEFALKEKETVMLRDIPCNMINCFCMFSDYQPMTLDEWIKIDRKRRERIGLMENHE